MSKAQTGASDAQSTKVVTSKVRFSFLHVFEPTSMGEDKDKKYSVSLIIPKTDTVLLDRLKKAIAAATEQGKTGKFGGKVPATLKLPLRDGDLERADDPSYANSFFMSASSKTKPGIVDANLQPIINETDIYSGCYGRASINFYPFNANGSKGVACGLNHIQKLEDGEALGSRGKAEDDFSDDIMG